MIPGRCLPCVLTIFMAVLATGRMSICCRRHASSLFGQHCHVAATYQGVQKFDLSLQLSDLRPQRWPCADIYFSKTMPETFLHAGHPGPTSHSLPAQMTASLLGLGHLPKALPRTSRPQASAHQTTRRSVQVQACVSVTGRLGCG